MVFAHNEIERIERSGIKTKTFSLLVSLNPLKLLRQIKSLKQIVQEFRPDIIHAHFGSLTAFVSALIAGKARLVITYRGSDLNPSPTDTVIRSLGQKFFSQLAALRADRIICVSRQLMARLWWAHNKTVVLPSGVDLDVFYPIKRSMAREYLKWPDDEYIVLFNAGANPKVKRLDLAEESIAVARRLIGNLRFVVLSGDTPHRELPYFHSGADCLIVTSNFEGSPDIIKEALACDLPIVSVDVGDVVERLQGVNPSRIVSRNPQVIGAAIAEILKMNQRSNGREKTEGISAAAIKNKLIEIYYSII